MKELEHIELAKVESPVSEREKMWRLPIMKKKLAHQSFSCQLDISQITLKPAKYNLKANLKRYQLNSVIANYDEINLIYFVL
jgi:hypothetical protein